jgi:hypothetical protein
MTREEADNAQEWAGMDGAIAFHLIDRHADGWNEVGAMMDAWARANRPGWHDAPTCDGNWISSPGAYLTIYTPDAYTNTGKKWYGPIPKYGKSICNIT